MSTSLWLVFREVFLVVSNGVPHPCGIIVCYEAGALRTPLFGRTFVYKCARKLVFAPTILIPWFALNRSMQGREVCLVLPRSSVFLALLVHPCVSVEMFDTYPRDEAASRQSRCGIISSIRLCTQ